MITDWLAVDKICNGTGIRPLISFNMPSILLVMSPVAKGAQFFRNRTVKTQCGLALASCPETKHDHSCLYGDWGAVTNLWSITALPALIYGMLFIHYSDAQHPERLVITLLFMSFRASATCVSSAILQTNRPPLTFLSLNMSIARCARSSIVSPSTMI